MAEKSNFEGKWIWENGDKEKKYIEFKKNKGAYELFVVYDGKNRVKADDLKLVSDKTKGKKPTWYLFSNTWLSKDEKKMFRVETQCVLNGKPGTFVNVTEFTFVNRNLIKQNVRGFVYDIDKEEWVPAERDDFLIRID